jgi:hypothetical protein
VSYFEPEFSPADPIRAPQDRQAEPYRTAAVGCPGCGGSVSHRDWQALVEQDFDGRALRLEAHAMPCCGGWFRVCDLRVDVPGGLTLRSAAPQAPSRADIEALEALVGCPVRVVVGG